MPQSDHTKEVPIRQNEVKNEKQRTLTPKEIRRGNGLLGYYIIFILMLCLVPVYTYTTKINDPMLRAMIYVGCAGGIGGTIRGMRSLTYHISQNDFGPQWTAWYVSLPIISTVMGVFVYFFIQGGLIVATSAENPTYEKGVMFYCGIAFLAGLFSTLFFKRLKEIAEALFGETDTID